MAFHGVNDLAFADLAEFLRHLEQKGDLKRIDTEVDPVLEITEITDRVTKTKGPALLFTRVNGSSYPLLINAFGTEERMAAALGAGRLNELEGRISKYLELPGKVRGSLLERLSILGGLFEALRVMPKTVKEAPCQEVVETEPDLNTLPVLHCWPQDGGRYITLPLVFTKNPETGQRNCGMYRMQVYDGKTTGMHWHIHKDGSRNYSKYSAGVRKMDVAAALGGDPAVIYAATAPLPPDIDEMIFAGFLRNSPVEMVKCKTVDIEVPARAEFILEGYVIPGEKRREGPFGDHTGYYSLADDYPVFHLTCITRRANPIYPTTIVGKPPMEDCFFGKATERLFLPLLKLLIPEIIDLNLPLEGVFHNCAVVAINKSYPGQGRKVMYALWGLGQMMFTKMIIVVDAGVNVHDMSTVWWKVYNNIDARRDVVVVDGPLDVLDHSSPQPGYGGKMGIDATKKLPGEGHFRPWPDELLMSREIKELVTRRWREYGIG
jgi:4-hydroxy-3-polyprenylbenzoate decarboxylase